MNFDQTGIDADSIHVRRTTPGAARPFSLSVYSEPTGRHRFDLRLDDLLVLRRQIERLLAGVEVKP